MNWGIFFTITGTGITIIAFIYQLIRNFREDLKKERKILEDKIFENDRRIFQIALGKDVKTILTQEYKTNQDK